MGAARRCGRSLDVAVLILPHDFTMITKITSTAMGHTSSHFSRKQGTKTGNHRNRLGSRLSMLRYDMPPDVAAWSTPILYWGQGASVSFFFFFLFFIKQ